MKRRRSARRGVSLGTIVMLLATVVVLAGFLMLLPTFTGNQDIRIDAAKLAVAMDESFSQLAATTEDLLEKRPIGIALPSEILATAAPQITQAPLATAAPTPVPTPPKRSFTLCASGSVEWNASVRKALTFDEAYQFHILTDQLSGALEADLSYAALSHTLSESAKLSDVNMPEEILQPLRTVGVNAVAIGHEHILNGGLQGMTETEQAVRNAGITPVNFASEIHLQNYNGVQVALLHYLDELSATGRKQVSEAQRNEAVSFIEESRMLSDIAAAKNAGAEVVVVSLRWGKSGASSPTDEQTALAQKLADAGADIILGTGSGVLQPVRVLSGTRGDQHYHPVLCAYSLGNLFSHDRQNRTTLCSILLRTKVVYDSANQTIAFEDLSYTPTYVWRGKDNKRTLVRVLLNDGTTKPGFVAGDQQKIMDRCFKQISDVMADTGIPMAE